MNSELWGIFLGQLTKDLMYISLGIFVAGMIIKINSMSKKNNKIIIIIAILIGFILVLLGDRYYADYFVDKHLVYRTELYSSILKDARNNEFVEITTDNISVYDTGNIGKNGMYGRYFLNIDNDTIPIKNVEQIQSLLFKKENGDMNINTVVVYKNSKLIKSINGVVL